MPFFTEQEVLQAAEDALALRRQPLEWESAAAALVDLFEVQNRSTEADESEVPTPQKTFDIFLSHSSLDASQVLGIYYVLKGRGYSMYLDRIWDPHLRRRRVSRKTATTIRLRMTQCRSLFVATSSNTTRSMWVLWELGFTDGLTGKAAVLPILPEDAVSFGGLTYFELYPTVQDDPSTRKPSDLTIWDGSSQIGTWEQWLAMSKRY